MFILRRPHLTRHLRFSRSNRVASVVSSAAAVRQDATLWTPAPLSLVESAAESLFHISIDISNSPDLAASYTRPGQYLQLRVPDVEKPSFLAIASPPSFAVSCGAFEFLVKSIAGSTAEILCGLKKGETVELSAVMGSGFDMGWIDHPVEYPTRFDFRHWIWNQVRYKDETTLSESRWCLYLERQKVETKADSTLIRKRRVMQRLQFKNYLMG